MDGIRAYHYVAYDYLRGEGFIPKRTILIGLLGLKDTPTRYRDFTPTSITPGAGGADRYLALLKQELIPLINSKYRTGPERSALVGGSLGGLFTIHALLNAPTLFKSYVAIDPSLWWDHNFMSAQLKLKTPGLKGLQRVLWISGREGQPLQKMGIDQFDATLRTEAPSDLSWVCRPYANETHLTTGIKGFWDGIKFCYAGYYGTGIGLKPSNGIVLKDEPFSAWCYQREASSYIRYTLDGSEPTLNSPPIASENRFTFSKDTQLTIKSFCRRKQYDMTVTGNFRVGSALPGVSQIEEGVAPGGLRFEYYEGEWDKPRDVTGLRPDRTGRADRNFDLAKLPGNATFICILEGFLKIDSDAYYIIELSDSGYSKVFLGGLQVIGDYFDRSGGATFILPLQKGYHRFRVVYFHRKGDQNLAPVYIKPEREDESPIPLETLYSRI